ncbi:MAG: MBL fold metallo-hydrolase [Deltaproteobacteria bacterium]|nr:MBL fold metallo-hydrolase [Deltaproteobacteria bacterium]
MRIGDYDCFDLVFERFFLDGGAMFGIIPKPLWERLIPADEKNRIPMTTRCLLISGNGKNILVDAGIGDKLSGKLVKRYGITRSGSPSELLGGLGIDATDITDVVLTHLHFDHTGGATRFDKDGNAVCAFPNAIYHVQKAQWEFAHSPCLRDEGSYLPENFLPLENAGVLNLIDGPVDGLFPGIDILVSHGHTPGQQHVLLPGLESVKGSALFFASDLVPTSAHIPLIWHMAYDNNPLDLISEKKAVLSRAAADDWVICFGHDPDNAAARVKSDDNGHIVIAEAICHV